MFNVLMGYGGEIGKSFERKKEFKGSGDWKASNSGLFLAVERVVFQQFFEFGEPAMQSRYCSSNPSRLEFSWE